MLRKTILFFMVVLLLSGCRPKPLIQEEAPQTVLEKVSEDSYNIVVPFNATNTRNYHATYSNSAFDFENIGERLMSHSKEYFPQDSYYLGEGSILKNEHLNRLVKRSGTEEVGLNPEKGYEFPTGKDNETILDAVIVNDIIEQNYYQKVDNQYVLAGASFAIVMNSVHTVTKGSVSYQTQVSDDILFSYGSDVARKLDRYVKSLSAVKNLPVLITLYVNGTNAEYLPGKMIGKAFFKERSPSFERLQERWYLFSSEFTSFDNENYSQFNVFKQALKQFLVEEVGCVGYGFYVKNQLQTLKIELDMRPKTYIEKMSVVRYSSELLQNFHNNTFDIEVEIKNLNETQAIILKKKGQSSIQPILLH